MKIKCFGIAKEITGHAILEVPAVTSVELLRARLETLYPELKTISSYMIAVNQSYAMNEDLISDDDEIAIIPPVSGG